jgi:hypothetical protein
MPEFKVCACRVVAGLDTPPPSGSGYSTSEVDRVVGGLGYATGKVVGRVAGEVVGRVAAEERGGVSRPIGAAP